jgi:hypothetical protein
MKIKAPLIKASIGSGLGPEVFADADSTLKEQSK